MDRTNKTKRAIAMAGLLAGLALAGVPAFAQTNAPAAPANSGSAMMDHGMPNGQDRMMPGMAMNGEIQGKMARMMDKCDRMMASMMQHKDGAPANKG
jgi:Spy/CpxP family protein refolding chaperone